MAEGYGDPNIGSMARLEQVMKGIKSTQAKDPGGKKLRRLPITPELLQKLKDSWFRGSGKDGCMLWAAATLCFFGFLRSGEITVPSDTTYDEGAHLGFRDVAVDNLQDPKSVRVRIKASKTDPFRMGVDVYVGKTGNQLCPVAAMLAYLIARGAGPGPLFRFQDGKPLTRVRLVAKVREALAAAGVDHTPYSGHSFRSGAATTAAKWPGYRRCNNKDAWPVEEQCLPAVYSDAKGAVGSNISTPGEGAAPEVEQTKKH